MSSSIYARDPITGAYKEIAAASIGGSWALKVDTSGGEAPAAVPYSTLIDDLGTTLYVGNAVPGSSTAAAVWQIKKILTVGSVTSIKFADSSEAFTQVWDNRASLSYP